MSDTIASIAATVAAEAGLTRAQLMNENRRPATHVRQEAWRRAYATGRFSLTQIGRVFKRDHTTIHYGIRRATERLAQ